MPEHGGALNWIALIPYRGLLTTPKSLAIDLQGYGSLHPGHLVVKATFPLDSFPLTLFQLDSQFNLHEN